MVFPPSTLPAGKSLIASTVSTQVYLLDHRDAVYTLLIKCFLLTQLIYNLGYSFRENRGAEAVINRNKQISHRYFRCLLILSCIVLVSTDFIQNANADHHKNPNWQPLQIINVQDFPWDENPRFKSKSKTIFRGPNGSSLIYSQFAPSWDMTPPGDSLGSHYHLWHEWGYLIEGDFILHEPVSVDQKHGVLNRFIQGSWLDRPAYTLHGGEWEIGGMRAQNASILLLFEEGDGSVVTVGPDGDHFKPDFPDKPVPYEPDWRAVKQFNHPWMVHSSIDLEWEPDQKISGRLVKWLSDDRLLGFRAQLLKIPPGWTAPADVEKTYFKQANRFLYVLYGDMQIWQFDNPGDDGNPVTVNKDHFIHQPPYGIWGYGKGPVTTGGAVWLEVTYAKGVAVGGGQIENASVAP